MPLCYPPNTDWACAFTAEQLEQMRADPETLRVMERSEAYAWYTLAALTAYQIGVCPTTVRPCAAGCTGGGTWMDAVVTSGSTSALPTMTIGRSFTPHVLDGQWVNSCGCSSSDACSCTAVSEVILPGPVGDITEVRVDGVVLAPTAYRVDNGNRLVRQDGGSWPVCQDMSKPADDPGAFTVTYYRGAAPNEITRFAAGALAVEFYNACTNKKCRLPRGTVSVVRNGATIELQPNLIDSIASWIEVAPVIQMFNPNRLKSAPRVLSPDRRPGAVRRQTWGAY